MDFAQSFVDSKAISIFMLAVVMIAKMARGIFALKWVWLGFLKSPSIAEGVWGAGIVFALLKKLRLRLVL